MTQPQPLITIIHFNDSYDLQQKYNKGGIVNFKAKVTQLKTKYPNSLFLFSGDTFSPSILSNMKQGWQMVPVLNDLGIDVACYGNHQFDYPHDHTLKLAKSCNFPWVLGNILFAKTKKRLGDAEQYIILEKNGLKIGIFGIAGDDWIGILSQFVQGQLQYIDHCEYSNKITKVLKEKQGCDIIIALTHMRNHQDQQFPPKVKLVDLVLGGHDHVVLHQFIDQTPIIKSGSNFRNIGLIHIYDKSTQKEQIKKGRNFNFQYQVLDVGHASQEYLDEKLQKYVRDLMQDYKKFDEVVGYAEIDLQARFSIQRTQQTPYGNFFADLMRLYLNSDMAFCNSGSIRNDCILHQGPIKYSQISNIINDALVVLQLTGDDIRQILEVSVSGLPKTLKGSFMQISGFRYTYSLQKPVGSRVLDIWFKQKLISKEQKYSGALYSYISKGNDGFPFLKNCKVLKDQTQTCSMLNLLQNFFHTLNEQLIPAGTQRVPCKKRSNKLMRITTLQHKVVLGDHGHLFASILPTIQNRILRVQQKPKQIQSNVENQKKQSLQ